MVESLACELHNPGSQDIEASVVTRKVWSWRPITLEHRLTFLLPFACFDVLLRLAEGVSE